MGEQERATLGLRTDNESRNRKWVRTGSSEIKISDRNKKHVLLNLYSSSGASVDTLEEHRQWRTCPHPETCPEHCYPSDLASGGRSSGPTPAECYRRELNNRYGKAFIQLHFDEFIIIILNYVWLSKGIFKLFWGEKIFAHILLLFFC